MVTKFAKDYLSTLAEELEISETRYDQAYERYHSIGNWLNREASTIKQFNPTMYVQGSFAFGTAIKPYTDAEEYDVDMVCELQNLTWSDLSQADLKHFLGKEIEAYRKANSMNKSLAERRRCWTLSYADDAQFHIDIVPALPNGEGMRLLLEQRRLDATWADTSIDITDNEEENYTVITDDWPRSNPKGYREWFKSRMQIIFESRKEAMAKSMQASIEDIPDYKVKTPLQYAIMILKRHRDIMFAGDKTNRSPISIIITTLAGHAYQGEEDVSDALYSILANMDRFILRDGRKYVIPNPSNPSENFADKWEEHPERKTAFFHWLEQTRQHFDSISGQYSQKVITEKLSPYIGRELANRTASRVGSSNQTGLLKNTTAATAGSAATTPSFGSEPRIPTKPKGFA